VKILECHQLAEVSLHRTSAFSSSHNVLVTCRLEVLEVPEGNFNSTTNSDRKNLPCATRMAAKTLWLVSAAAFLLVSLCQVRGTHSTGREAFTISIEYQLQILQSVEK
jgi:hypothetical protein